MRIQLPGTFHVFIDFIRVNEKVVLPVETTKIVLVLVKRFKVIFGPRARPKFLSYHIEMNTESNLNLW